MALTFINVATYASDSSYSATISKPTNTTEGDIMFAFVVKDYGLANSVPTGWTSVANKETGHASEIFYKVAGASEPSSYTFGFPASSSRLKVTIATYRDGFNKSNPIDVVSNTDYFTSNTTLRAASMTVSSSNSPLLFFGWAYRTNIAITFTKPSVPTTDWVENYDGGDANSDFYQEICSMTWTSSGSTGDIDATLSTLNADKHAYAIALNIPVSGPVNVKTINGLAIASVKTVNGLDIASVKTINGLA